MASFFMPDYDQKYVNQVAKDEHDNTGLVKGKRVFPYVWDAAALAWVKQSGSATGLPASGLALPLYDYVSMALSNSDRTETYTFKTGGSGGTLVATVAVVYTTSDRDVLVSVTKT